MRNRIFTITLLVLVSMTLFAGGQSEGMSEMNNGVIPLRMTTWTGNETQLNMFHSMAEEFNASQDTYDIELSVDSIPFGDYVSKITLQLSGSNPPDLGWLVESSAPTFVNAGVLENLSEDLKAYDYEDFAPGAMGLWIKEDSVYGVPFSTSPFIVLYNKTLFEKAGVPTPSELEEKGEWTWETFREVSKSIKDNTGVYGFQGMDGGAYDQRIMHNLVPIIRGYGSDAWDENGKVIINSPEAVKAVQLFHDMLYMDGSVVPPGDLSDFYAGNAAMTVGQISRVSKLKDVDWEWEIAVMPQGPAGGNSSYTIGQAAVVSFSASKNSEAATAFTAFMTNKENVAKMAQFWPPARKSVMTSEDFVAGNSSISRESMVEAVVPGLESGMVLPSHEKYPQIYLSASSEFDNLWNKDADVQTVLDAVAEAIKSQM